MAHRIIDVVRDLEKNRKDLGKALFTLIVERATEDPDFCAKLDMWLQGEGSTVLLREELCAPFKGHDIFAVSKRRYPWYDAFTQIDSAMLHLRVARMEAAKQETSADAN